MTATAQTTTAPPAATLASHGLLTMDCETHEIQLLDPGSGSVLASMTLGNYDLSLGSLGNVESVCSNESQQVLVPDEASAIAEREQFNGGYGEVAWTSQQQPDGSTDVGYEETGPDPTYTNVTAATEQTGFSASTPTDSAPVFDPASGMFYFLRTTNGSTYYLWKYNTATGQGGQVGRVRGASQTGMLTVQGGRVIDGPYVLSPNGQLVAGEEDNVVPFFTPPANNAPLIAGDPDEAGGNLDPNGTTVSPPNSSDDYPIEVYGWIGNTAGATSISEYGNDPEDIFSIPVNTSGEPYVKPTDMLPTNSNTNLNAVVSPDGTQMAFLSQTNGGDYKLYVTSTAPGSTPTLVSGDVGGMALLAWQ